jgi:hypothetical protein
VEACHAIWEAAAEAGSSNCGAEIRKALRREARLISTAAPYAMEFLYRELAVSPSSVQCERAISVMSVNLTDARARLGLPTAEGMVVFRMSPELIPYGARLLLTLMPQLKGLRLPHLRTAQHTRVASAAVGPTVLMPDDDEDVVWGWPPKGHEFSNRQFARLVGCDEEAAACYNEACRSFDSPLVAMFEAEAPFLCLREVALQIRQMPDLDARRERLEWAVNTCSSTLCARTC